MTDVHLVMPMAGRGSRFSEAGFALPKPMLRLYGQPFFWWATESIVRCFSVQTLTYVILAEHASEHGLDRAIADRYPRARIVTLDEPTPGALVTAVAGCQVVPGEGTVIVNDCDHAFRADTLAASLPRLADGAAGFLCHFRSSNPAYSFAEYGRDGALVRTVEKQAVSDMAIAGAYGFHDRDTFLRHAALYEQDCPYAEPFMSGVYNTITAYGGVVRGGLLDRHVSFGTPAEFDQAADAMLPFRSWPEMAALA